MKLKAIIDHTITTLFSGMFLLSSGASLGSSVSLSQLKNVPLVDTVTAASRAVELEQLEAPGSAELTVAESFSSANLVTAPMVATAAPVSGVVIGAGGIPVISYHDSANFDDCNWALNNVPASGARACVGSANTFLFGHNSYDTFRVLYGVSVGNTIVYNGVNYRVTAAVPFNVSAVPMNQIVYGTYGGGGYNLSLMTCYGAGDSQRLVIFATSNL